MEGSSKDQNTYLSTKTIYARTSRHTQKTRVFVDATVSDFRPWWEPSLSGSCEKTGNVRYRPTPGTDDPFITEGREKVDIEPHKKTVFDVHDD